MQSDRQSEGDDMTDDRTLLERAAKAAGIDLEWFEVGEGDPDCDAGWYCQIAGTHRLWNPRDDDGDAFRLQVKLKLHIGYSGGNQYFAAPSDSDKNCMRESGERNGTQDPYAATRRAVVRAAAAMAPTGEPK
jgi:hypothetical protein